MSYLTDALNKIKQLPQINISQLFTAFLLVYIASTMANITWLVLPSGVNDAQSINSGVASPTDLDLTLTATVAQDVSGKGTVVIDSKGIEGTYGIDDKIDLTFAIVKQVFFDRVIIQNGRKREMLMLDGVAYDNKNVASPITTLEVLR